MKVEDKTRSQLIDELTAMRRRVDELEAAQAETGRADRMLGEKLEFEKTISGICSRFIGVSDLDDAIDAMLADIGKLSGASRSYLFLLREDGATMDNTHEWCAEGVNPEIRNLQNLQCDMFPWWMKRLRKREDIHIKDVSKLPRAAEAERRILESQDIKSVLALPLHVGKNLAGFVGLDNVVEAGEWKDAHLMLLRVVLGIIGRALEQELAEEALRESEENFRALAENSHDGITVIADEGRHVYANPQAAAITGYSVSELLNNTFRDLAHPDELVTLTERYRRRLDGDPVPSQYETVILRKNGQSVPIEVSATRTVWQGRPAAMVMYRDIAERKRMEEELQSSEERYRSVVENARDAVYTVSPDGLITSINRAFETITGWQCSEWIGKPFAPIIHPDDLPRVTEALQVSSRGQTGQLHEARILTKSGDYLPLEFTGAPLFADEDLIGYLGIGRDITERKKTREALQAQESYFRSLIENSQDGITILRGDGTVSYVSPSCERILGFGPDEIMGLNPLEWGHPDDMSRVSVPFAQFLQERGSTARAEVRAQHKDGSWHWIEVVASNLLDDPAIEGVVVNWRDVTERVQAEKTLRHSEEYFRALIENSLDAVAMLNSDGTLGYQSPSFERVLGYEPEETMGKDPLEFVDPDDMTRIGGLLAQMLGERGSTMRDEARVLHKDGSWRTLEVVASNLLDMASVAGIVANFRDITDRKQMEEKLTNLYEQERQLRQQLEEEMNRRIEFTRTLAHELKTPLTSVVASSDSLLAKLHDEPLLSLARNIGRGASNLNSRIDELLDMAKGEVGILELKLETVDVMQLLRDAADNMAPVAAGQSQTLVLEVPPSLPQVRADAARLQQVVLNLLSNALKFTPRDGKIKLKAGEKSGALIVEVQDTGPGVSVEEQERLFKPYQRLESDKGRLSGLGLGLALCKTLVELHEGQIWVKSRTGRGATFGFSLPLEVPSRRARESHKVEKLWKVLIIEDDLEIIDSISLGFQMDWPEAKLISARLGEDGIDMVETEDPEVVILDLGLPDMSGFEVLRRIRLFSAVPVIVLTVKSGEADITRGLEWGADDYLTKPFRQKELLARLKVQLRRQTSPDEEAPIICGSLRLDPSTYQLTYGSREISLTIIEGRIMQHLMRNAGHVATHARLAEAVWGEDYPGALDSLRVYIRYLREKLEANPSSPKLILTKPGIGYLLTKPT